MFHIPSCLSVGGKIICQEEGGDLSSGETVYDLFSALWPCDFDILTNLTGSRMITYDQEPTLVQFFGGLMNVAGYIINVGQQGDLVQQLTQFELGRQDGWETYFKAEKYKADYDEFKSHHEPLCTMDRLEFYIFWVTLRREVIRLLLGESYDLAYLNSVIEFHRFVLSRWHDIVKLDEPAGISWHDALSRDNQGYLRPFARTLSAAYWIRWRWFCDNP